MREPSKRGPGIGLAPRFYLCVKSKQLTSAIRGWGQYNKDYMTELERAKQSLQDELENMSHTRHDFKSKRTY